MSLRQSCGQPSKPATTRAIVCDVTNTGSFGSRFHDPLRNRCKLIAAPDTLEVHYEEPIERAFGDVHDKCTRNHTRKRLYHLVQDVKQHLQVNAPWPYVLSDLYYTPEVTAAVAALEAAKTSQEETLPLAA